jgi:predicted TIM-barrel fold metal-dependent hydrolase
VLSLVAEGVFERHPSIRVVLSELGFGWIPSLMWRYDKDWKALWRETPWVHERPSAYIRRHFRATTSPTQIPRRVTGFEVEQFVGMLGASEFLMYSSDYPHDHGEDGSDKLLAALDTEGREAVLRGNAATFYGIDTSPEASGLDGASRDDLFREKRSRPNPER